MCDCLNCSDITIPNGSQGPTGPQGPSGSNGTNGTNGTDGLNGAALIDSLFDRDSTNGTSYSLIDAIPIDVTTVFSENKDGIEFDISLSFNYVSGTDGGNCKIVLTDGVNSIILGTTPAMSSSLHCTMSGFVVRDSDSSINYKIEINQPGGYSYSAPRTTISGVKNSVIYISRNPGTIDNTSTNLKLSVYGILNAGTNNIKVEHFIVKSFKQLI